MKRYLPLVLVNAGFGCVTEVPLAVDSAMPVTTTYTVPLPVCINEFGPAGDNFTDDAGAQPDWIELHNPGMESVSLLGWYLTDDGDETWKHPLDGSLSIPPGGFLVFSADGTPELGALHLDFRLSVGGEAVGLYHHTGGGELIRYGSAVSNYTWARSPDCCPDPDQCMRQVYLGTPGAPNAY